MILRPVRPASPTGPPITNRPVGLTSRFLRSLLGVVEVLGQDRLDDVLPEVVRDQRLGALLVLRGDQQLLDLDRHAVAVAHGDLRLAVGPQVGERCRRCAPRARRCASLCASEIGSGISSSVSRVA